MSNPTLARGIVYATRGIAASNSPQAASAGARVLAEGGNAFDAALTVAAVEAVTQPPMCALGGEVFVVLHDARTGKVHGLNGSGAAPSGMSLEFAQRQGWKLVPNNGPFSIAVPGEVDAWVTLHEKFCTRPFKQLLEPAIGYAEEGCALSPKIAVHYAESIDNLKMFPATAAVLTRDGRPFRAGDRIVQRDLAASLRRVAAGGSDEFYRGDLARRMLAGLQAAGGLFTAEDFANHRTEWYEPPLATTYRGHTVYQTRPPSQGFLLLEMLNILEGFDLRSLGHNSAEAIHRMVEAKQIAFADRNQYAGDPRFVDWPLERLISKAYAEQARARMDPQQVTVPAPQMAGADVNTSYFCVADAQGNCISFVHSLSKAFGSDFIAPGTGVLFNNRAGRGFSLQADHPNVLAPGKRTMHTLNAYLVCKDCKPLYVGGTPGGDFQTQGHVQVLTGLLDYGLDLQQAVDAPRWYSSPGTDPVTLHQPVTLQVEGEMPEETQRGLAAMGHHVAINPLPGRVQLIAYDHARGTLAGASDSRGDGYAAAA